VLGVAVLVLLATGCARGPQWLTVDQQRPIDRAYIEYPSGYELIPVARGLNAPTAVAFDEQGTIFIAESGGGEPHIFARRQDGSQFTVYPLGTRIPFTPIRTGTRIFGPIGGMIVHAGRVYVTHRDADRKGVITAFTYDGRPTTIVADLPAQGDYGATDLALHPNGRLFFGVGSATNSGVVGLDNYSLGWLRKYRSVCDVPAQELKLNPYRFDTPNPWAGLFGGDSISVTGSQQAFGTSTRTRVRPATNARPNAALFSVSPTGGDVRVEATGIHVPRGLAFNEFNRLFCTNNGMELRGTRPVKDDNDALLRIVPGTDYGWPDFSGDLQPISGARFQPPVWMIIKTGYPELSFLIDRPSSNLANPDRNTLVAGVFGPLAGAARFAFVPPEGSFKQFRGSAIVALWGDRAPFATNGMKMTGPTGYKVVRVDTDAKEVTDFVHNTSGLPLSQQDDASIGLERPIDIKFGPDGAMYLLDFGAATTKMSGQVKATKKSGALYKLVPLPVAPATQPES